MDNIADLAHFSYLGLFLFLALIGFFAPIPEEIIILSIGYLSALGFFPEMPLLLLATFLGILSGDLILFFLAYKGSGFTNKTLSKFGENKVEKYNQFMEKNCGKTVFSLRFIYGLRLFGPILAGSQEKKNLKKFIFFDSLALIIYIPVFIFLGHHFYHNISKIISEFEIVKHSFFIIFIIVIVCALSYFIRKWLKEKLKYL